MYATLCQFLHVHAEDNRPASRHFTHFFAGASLESFDRLGIGTRVGDRRCGVVVRRCAANLLGHLKPEVSFGVLGINLENFLAALGMNEGSPNITGAGTSADPIKAFIDGTKMDENSAVALYINGVRKDGRTLTMFLMDCNLMYDDQELTAGRGTKTLIQFKVVPSMIRWIEID